MTEVEAVREEEGWVLGKVWEEQLWVVGEMEVVEERASFGDGSLGGRFAFSSSSVIRGKEESPLSDGTPKSTEYIRSPRLSERERSLRSILVMSA